MLRLLLTTLVLAALAGLQPAAIAASRVALVIGNSHYAHTTFLPNPVNDANDVAAALGDAGFSVEPLVLDAGKTAIELALKTFAAKAEGAEQVVVYYAGHGVEANGDTFLVPVDATLLSDRTVKLEAVGLDDVVAVVSGASQLGLVILDACRNNPMAERMTRIDKNRGGFRGLGATAGDSRQHHDRVRHRSGPAGLRRRRQEQSVYRGLPAGSKYPPAKPGALEL